MITVIADDLTGAAEVAGICLRYGLQVSFGIDNLPATHAEVNIIATDSRSMTAEEAYSLHHRLAGGITTKKQNHTIFKKCDSVLRGHILTECSALMAATGKEAVLLQPANPANNRCIEQGSYKIGASLIEHTAFYHDPDFPATTSSVKALLLRGATSPPNIKSIYPGTVSAINAPGLFIPDCCSVGELAGCVALDNENTLLGGSAAFFEQFLLVDRVVSPQVKPKKDSILDHYLLISGSTHGESIQFAALLKDRCAVMLFPGQLLFSDAENSALSAWIKEVADAYNTCPRLVLRVSDHIVQFPGSSKILKNRMSDVVKGLFELSSISELCIEGGATAYDVLQKLSWKSFTPVAELAPGVIRMQYDGDHKKHITLKPGSYKWPEALFR